jgi:cytochrome P450
VRDAAPENLLDRALADQSLYRDPYPCLARLRETAPVVYCRSLQGWFVTSHALVAEALSHPALSAMRTGGDDAEAFNSLIRNWIIFMDPPPQRPRRAALGAALSKALAKAGPLADDLAKERLTAFAATGGGDFMAEVARPLTLHVICDLLGVPITLRPGLSGLTTVLGRLVGRHPMAAEEHRRAEEQVVFLWDLMRSLVQDRRRCPGEDILSALAQTESEDNAAADAILLLFGGQDTSANLAGNLLAHLAGSPEAWSLLSRDEAANASLVEEGLRFDPPVPTISRRAREAIRLGGVEIEAGDRVMVSLAAANRDPSVFAEPDRFLVGRSGRHLAFGHGAHLCLGAALARIELCAVLRHLAAFPTPWRLNGLTRYVPSLMLRGPISLPLATGGAGATARAFAEAPHDA